MKFQKMSSFLLITLISSLSGLHETDQMIIFQILAALLHFGNVFVSLNDLDNFSFRITREGSDDNFPDSRYLDTLQ